MEVNLEGLLKDGYTFICPKHGLHPNCDCEDNQIKVWSDDNLIELQEENKILDNKIAELEELVKGLTNLNKQYYDERRKAESSEAELKEEISELRDKVENYEEHFKDLD